MVLNPNLCTHKWRYANTLSGTGAFKPIYSIILYCEKCAKIKEQKIK